MTVLTPVSLGRHQFTVFSNTADLQDRSGIYAILDEPRYGGNYKVLDIGESATVKTRVENHDRQNCWMRNQQGILRYAVLYTLHSQQRGRKEIEQELRALYRPVCGIR